MAIAIKFDKDRAQHYLDCLAQGKDIKAPAGGWTGNDMLALAGACHFGAMSQGPQSFWLKEIPADLHAEHAEQKEEQFFIDLGAAIEFYSQLTMLVQDEEYDNSFRPEAFALVSKTIEGEVHQYMKPVKGFLEYSDVL
jgi:hypothetical protein